MIKSVYVNKMWKLYVGVSCMLVGYEHVAVHIKYFNIYVCAFVGMNNKQ